MDITIRQGRPADAEICGMICYNAFKMISEAHGFTPDFPAPEVPIGLLEWMLAHPKFYGAVAEVDGRIVGSNFLDERNPIAGVGPITAMAFVLTMGDVSRFQRGKQVASYLGLIPRE